MKRVMILFVTLCICLFLKTNVALALLISDISDPLLSGAEIIDFNSETPGFYSDLIIDGIGFINETGGGNIAESLRIWDYNNENPTNQLSWIDGKSMEVHYLTNPTIKFPGKTDFIAFQISFIDGPWTLEVYDSLGNLLESKDISGSPSGPPTDWEFHGIANDEIYSAKLISDGSDNIMIDNLYYSSSSSVPEPATIFMLTGGLVVFLVRGKSN